MIARAIPLRKYQPIGRLWAPMRRDRLRMTRATRPDDPKFILSEQSG